jgi:hypothetical protein
VLVGRFASRLDSDLWPSAAESSEAGSTGFSMMDVAPEDMMCMADPRVFESNIEFVFFGMMNGTRD